jgi:hypothetical protein
MAPLPALPPGTKVWVRVGGAWEKGVVLEGGDGPGSQAAEVRGRVLQLQLEGGGWHAREELDPAQG